MDFSFNLPVRIISGVGCIQQHADLFQLGQTAFIVTGQSGAAKSGALADVLAVLEKNGIPYHLFDKIEANPCLSTCFEGGHLAADTGADFVIGIGGGSALDAAKAIAAFAANQQIMMEDLFADEKRVNRSLPILAVPTTSGTGSEVNPFSVMSLPDGERKRSFSAPDSWPKAAFLDPTYTYSLSAAQTLSTALDAFAHAMESYLSPRSTEISGMMALYAAEKIWPVIRDNPKEYTPDMHAQLLCASCAAGIAISITGTGFPHPLGYSLTMLHRIPHGRACAVFEGDFIRYNRKTEQGRRRLDELTARLSVDAETLATGLTELANVDFSFSESEIHKMIHLVCDAKNYANSPYVISYDEMLEIYRSNFLK